MKKIANRFFYQLDYKNDPIPGTLARYNRKPVHGNWVEVVNQCCPQPNCPECPEDPVIPDQTIDFTYGTPDIIEHRIHLIGEQGQGYFVTGILVDTNTTEQLIIPNTGTYTVILEVITGFVTYTISLTNSGIVGFNDAEFPALYTATGQDLSAVIAMVSATPSA